jgi:hypothetical protein
MIQVQCDGCGKPIDSYLNRKEIVEHRSYFGADRTNERVACSWPCVATIAARAEGDRRAAEQTVEHQIAAQLRASTRRSWRRWRRELS